MNTDQSKQDRQTADEPAKAISASRFIHRKILGRLGLGWLFLSVTIGGIIFWLEVNRAEQFVHQLALKESAIFSGESAHDLEQLSADSTRHLTQLAETLVGQHFLVVELYDKNKQLKLEAVRPGNEFAEQIIDQYRHQFPRADGFTHDLHFVHDQLLLVILVPLKGNEPTTPSGYFEGLYQVDQATVSAMRQDIVRTLAFVTLGIFFSCILMYPIVLALNRGIIKLSSELLQGNLELMNVLGCAIAERDSETNSRNYRVTYYALRLGEAIGLPRSSIRDLIAGAFLHDVGKIGIRDPILMKPEKLTADEFEIMKSHVALGVDILNKSSWLRAAQDVVQFHHEKYDGSGYLQGLKGKAIPLNARIFAIVDVFDALTSKRHYKDSWSLNDAIEMLEKESGRHFDPELVSRFSRIAPKLYAEIGCMDAHRLESLLHPIIGDYFLINAGRNKRG